MFWPLLLAHLVADYPLQSDWMVQAKKSWPGLTVHVAVHLVTMLIVLNGCLRLAWHATWPTILAVTVLHFGTDVWKNIFARRWPQWVIGGYLQDQALHITWLLLVAYAQARTGGGSPFAIDAPWILYGCGFILVTHVWFVTERVIASGNQAHLTRVNAQCWPRMTGRALLFSILLTGWNLWGLAALIIALTLYRRDLTCPGRRHTLLIDSGVVLMVSMLTQWVLMRA
jgi:hypothetical protein